MLSSHEQRIWDDIERCYDAEIEEPVRPGARPSPRRGSDGRGVDDLPAVVVTGIWLTIVLVIFDAGSAGLAVGAATVVGWLAWRCWPLLRGQDAATAGPTGGMEVQER